MNATKENPYTAMTRSERTAARLYLLPLAVFIVIFILLPVLGTSLNSFFRDVSFLDRSFVFLENYLLMAKDASFWKSVLFTLLFAAVSVPLEIVLGLAWALVLSQPLPGSVLLRGSILIPWAIPAAVSARIWQLIYSYNYGLANALLSYLPLSTGPVNWLGSGVGAFCSVVAADVWKTTPFVTIILLAGLAAIPEHLYRQAKVDGAGLLKRFQAVTLPLLKPVLVVALLFRTIDALRIFDIIYVLTSGGPGGATTSLSIYGYRYFLSGDFGFGSAVSVVLFLIALLISVFYIRNIHPEGALS